jgi:hypothetical protein
MEVQQEIEVKDWLKQTPYLKVADVVDGDTFQIVEYHGLVDSFGKKKLQLLVDYRNVKTLINLNKKQASMIAGANIGAIVQLTKIPFNGGSTLNLKLS